MIRRELIYLWYYMDTQFWQLFPYWALGILLGSFVSVFLKKTIHENLQNLSVEESPFWGIFLASLLGAASPLCLYGTIPLAASLNRCGLKEEWLGAFMMTSILLNPQLLFYSLALGKAAFLVRLFSGLICGIAAGLLLHQKTGSFFSFGNFLEPENHDTDPRPTMRFLKNVGRNLKITGPYFVVGLVISALFQRYVPPSLLNRFFGGSKMAGVFMAATIGVPLYVCGGGTIPLLQEWLWRGLSLGGAAAFMLTGPATKINNVSALSMVLGRRHAALYFLFVMTYAALTGFVVDWLVG